MDEDRDEEKVEAGAQAIFYVDHPHAFSSDAWLACDDKDKYRARARAVIETVQPL